MSDLPLVVEKPARVRLLARYRRLVLLELPGGPSPRGWVVRADHCFDVAPRGRG